MILGQKQSFSFESVKKSSNDYDVLEQKFTNSDNLRITFHQFYLDNPSSKLIFVHGGGANSKLGYFELANILREKYNVETTLIDLVGHGKSEGKRGDCVTTESTFKDLVQLSKLINLNNKPIYLGGHSSGGGHILNFHSWQNDTIFKGYIFVAPEFGYKSKTAKKDRIEFAKVEIGKFILSAFSGGKLYLHSYAVELNYPQEILEANPLIVTKLTVNMANALTPQNPQKQISKITQPIAIFIGEHDELFDIQKVISYKDYQKNKNDKSITQIIKNGNHLSILQNIGDNIGLAINHWEK
jgi:alpha-beta hydrolase superfamily lysophospholipase